MWNFKKNFFRTPIQEKQNVVIIPDFDYAVFTYQFFDGNDLDTWTRVVLPLGVATAALPIHYVGYSRNYCIPTSPLWMPTTIPPDIYVDWAGDNRGVGFESVFVDLTKIKQDFSDDNLIKVDLRCAWYGVIGVVPVEVRAVFYKGGQMVKSGFQYSNFDFVDKVDFTTSTKQISTKFQESPSKERFATFTYDIATGIGTFDLYDTTTPTL
jgi:hypothetical protein